LIRRVTLLTAGFMAFLYPLSSSGGVSINYSFALLPVGWMLLRGRVKMPPPVVVAAAIVYAFVLVAAIVLDGGANMARRLASFVVFMSLFAYSVIEVDTAMSRAFRRAVVIISVLFSLVAIYKGVALDLLALGYGAKDAIGSQRFGFVYLMAFWLLVFHVPRTRLQFTGRFAALSVVTTGLLLTFSRASIVALVGSVLVFAVINVLRWLGRPTKRGIATAFAAVTGVAVLLVLLQQTVPYVFQYADTYLVQYARDTVALREKLSDRTDSFGTRAFIARRVAETVASSPLTGSGYLGVWILPDLAGIAGSAHNQYLDVLFRTGVLGGAAYGALLLFLLTRLRPADRGLYWGMVAVLIYGMFHETFKESQGAALLAALIGIASEHWRRSRAAFVVRHPVVPQPANPLPAS